MTPCPNCPQKQQNDYFKYGFTLMNGAIYWTKIPEVKQCCAIKVKLIDHTASNVTMEYEGKTYIKSRKDFMESSWRDIDSY